VTDLKLPQISNNLKLFVINIRLKCSVSNLYIQTFYCTSLQLNFGWLSHEMADKEATSVIQVFHPPKGLCCNVSELEKCGLEHKKNLAIFD